MYACLLVGGGGGATGQKHLHTITSVHQKIASFQVVGSIFHRAQKLNLSEGSFWQVIRNCCERGQCSELVLVLVCGRYVQCSAQWHCSLKIHQSSFDARSLFHMVCNCQGWVWTVIFRDMALYHIYWVCRTGYPLNMAVHGVGLACSSPM